MRIVFELKSPLGDQETRGEGCRAQGTQDGFRGNFMTKCEPLEGPLYVVVSRGTDTDALEPLREEPMVHGNNHLQIKVGQAVKQEGGSWFDESLVN